MLGHVDDEPKKVKKTLAPRICEHCGKSKQVMVTMAPGEDGRAWWLCSPCYVDGLRPWNDKAAS